MGIPAAMIGYVGMESDLRYVPDCFTAAMQFLFTMILYHRDRSYTIEIVVTPREGMLGQGSIGQL